eukprot:snap_masked-scaffold_4-processed-gene-7.26-mRNA-1 protein AED:1.00 eAED:1.00 QI:0/-1/0/0/-1/1/1/0/505
MSEFFNDLENLSEDSDIEDENDKRVPEVKHEFKITGNIAEYTEKVIESSHLEELSKLLKKVKSLSSSTVFRNLINKIDDFNSEGFSTHQKYDLIMEVNTQIFQLDAKIFDIYVVITDKFGVRFKELPNLVPELEDYIKTVRLIGNETEVANLDLSSILPQALVMSVSLTFDTTVKVKLEQEVLSFVEEACDEALSLIDIKNEKLLPFVKTHIKNIAPNICALVGPEVCSLALGFAGGLEPLSKLPSGNIIVLGKKDKTISGMSASVNQKHFGVLYQTDMVQTTMKEHRRKVMRTVSGRVALCARLDLASSSPDGSQGQLWRDEIQKKIKKWEEPNPGKSVRPLPKPGPSNKTRRAGRRLRKRKEMLAQTELQKSLNKVDFAGDVVEYGDSSMGNDYGKVGRDGVRILAKSVSLKRRKTAKEIRREKQIQKQNEANRYRNHLRGIKATNTGAISGGGDTGMITSGFASTVALAEGQGIELVNPELTNSKTKRIEEANKKWFSGGFN